MTDLTQKQKQLLAEALSNLGVALITIGAIAPFFDIKLSLSIKVTQFTFATVIGIIFIIIGLHVIKK